MNQRPGGLPSPEQVIELLDAVFARAGYEIEAVSIDDRTRPPRVRVIADGDVPLDLDAAAELSRSASELLDTVEGAQTPYVLEVTSPGVERPLTEEKHFRRAVGRKIEAHLADNTTLTGRIASIADGAADLVVPDGRGWTLRRILLADISKAVVQVEFSPPSEKELELVGRNGG